MFYYRVRGMRDQLHRERQAWEARVAVENLGSGCWVLVVRSGGARGVAA